MTFDQAVARLIALASANQGVVTAAQVEADQELSSEPNLVSAAARSIAGGTNAFSAQDDDGRAWFPFSSITFSELPHAT